MLYTSLPEYATSITNIVVSMFIGVALAAFMLLYHKYVLGSFIRHLLKSKALTPESGIRLDETVFAKRPLILMAISGGQRFRNILRYTEPEEQYTLPKEPKERDFRRAKRTALLTRRYYIPYELTFRADNLYNKRGTNLFAAILTVILFAVLSAAMLVVIPDLLTMLQNFINGLS